MTADVTDSVHELLTKGIPVGPLGDASTMLRTSNRSKYHSDPGCQHLNGYYTEQVHFLNLAPGNMCTKCVKGPPDPGHAKYVKDARTVLRTQVAYRQFVAHLTETGLDSVDLDTPVPLPDTVTWHHVAQVATLQQALDAVHGSTPPPHPDLVQYATPVTDAVTALHTALRDAATTGTGTTDLIRSCVIDLMGTYTHSYAVQRTPDTSQPVVNDPEKYPALCTTETFLGARPTAQGYKDLVLEAWQTWREEVRATGDPTTARDVVLRTTTIDTHAPANTAQLCLTTPTVPAPPGGTPWEWLTAQWRHDARVELEQVLDQWAQTYTHRIREATDAPPRFVLITGYEARHRNDVNASTEVLTQLPMTPTPHQDQVILIAPGAVAHWLEKFSTVGTYDTERRSYSRPRVAVLDAASPQCGITTLQVAVDMWPNHGSSGKYLSPVLDAATAATT